MGSRWLIRRFRTGPQSKPRGHVSSPRSPVAGVPLASYPGVAERSGGFARGRASTPIRTWSARARAPPPGSPGATTHTDPVPTLAACARRAFRGTRVVARRNARSTSSSSTTPSGPAQPFRLARVPRPGMTKTDVRRRTHPGDQTRQGPPYARSITSRTLSRTNAHAYTDTDDNRAVGLSPHLRLDRSADRFPLAPLRNGAALSCGIDERGAAGTLPGAAQGRRIPDPVPSASGPQIAATAVERRGADAPGVAGTVPGVAGRVAGIACRVRDRGVARAGLRSGSVGTGGCRAAQRLRAGRLARRQTRCQQRTP